jgi:8-oxo-dGTP pyrophosphatase MutT (NUDIX family)
MPVEKSAGAIIFFEGLDKKREYLLLQPERAKEWGFPKGLIEKGESLEEAALREIKEETGIQDLELINGFKETVKFFYKAKYDYQFERGFKPSQTVLKFVTYFLAKAKNKDVKLSFESSDFAWVEPEEAIIKLSFKQNKELLTKAENFLARE